MIKNISTSFFLLFLLTNFILIHYLNNILYYYTPYSYIFFSKTFLDTWFLFQRPGKEINSEHCTDSSNYCSHHLDRQMGWWLFLCVRMGLHSSCIYCKLCFWKSVNSFLKPVKMNLTEKLLFLNIYILCKVSTVCVLKTRFFKYLLKIIFSKLKKISVLFSLIIFLSFFLSFFLA